MRKLMFKKALAIVAALSLILGLFAFAFASSSKTIRLGVNLELSGAVAQYGQRTLEGLKMAVEEINQKTNGIMSRGFLKKFF